MTCSNAAKNGHIECLKYAHENRCPWDEQTCWEAAESGSLECLKYSHENGCPWDEMTCSNAAKKGHVECLRYACENGCPGSANYVHRLRERTHESLQRLCTLARIRSEGRSSFLKRTRSRNTKAKKFFFFEAYEK